jgi:hypothetical protein
MAKRARLDLSKQSLALPTWLSAAGLAQQVLAQQCEPRPRRARPSVAWHSRLGRSEQSAAERSGVQLSEPSRPCEVMRFLEEHGAAPQLNAIQSRRSVTQSNRAIRSATHPGSAKQARRVLAGRDNSRQVSAEQA